MQDTSRLWEDEWEDWTTGAAKAQPQASSPHLQAGRSESRQHAPAWSATSVTMASWSLQG